MSMVVLIVLACFGIILRFYIVEREHDPLLPGILLILLIQGGYNGIQV